MQHWIKRTLVPKNRTLKEKSQTSNLQTIAHADLWKMTWMQCCKILITSLEKSQEKYQNKHKNFGFINYCTMENKFNIFNHFKLQPL